MESNTKIQMEQLRKFTETAKYTSEKQKEAILKLILLTGLADEIEEVDMKVNGERQTRSNVLLPELKGKTKEEINEYLDKHNVYEVFSSLKDKGISNDELDRIIVGFTQKCWFARDKNGERIYGTPPESLTKFDDYESTTGKKGVVRLTLEELNIFNSERKETKITDEEIKNTTTVALLGANVRGMEERIKYLLSTGLKDYQLFFLVGQRNLLKTEREIDGLLEKLSDSREELAKYLKYIEDCRDNIVGSISQSNDYRNKYAREERLKTLTAFFSSMLQVRQEYNRTIQTEIDIRRRLDKKDGDEITIDIKSIAKQLNEEK